MYFIDISKAETGLKVRTPIVTLPHPPPTKPRNKRDGSKVRILTGHVFSREKKFQKE